MKISEHLQQLHATYQIVDVIDLDKCINMSYSKMQIFVEKQCKLIHRESYQSNERIIFILTHDVYVKHDPLGLVLRTLQSVLLYLNIYNFFVIVISTNPDINEELKLANNLGSDRHTIKGLVANDKNWTKTEVSFYPRSIKDLYQNNPNNRIPSYAIKKNQDLLTNSKVFCMYPWVHLHVNSNNVVKLCSSSNLTIGNAQTTSLNEIWRSDTMKQIRTDMLNGKPISACKGCYEKEVAGCFSNRMAANANFGNNIDKVLQTDSQGNIDSFEMHYWDIRFSNLCNLSCRSCGYHYSSSWYQDQAKLAGTDWARKNRPLNIAGRSATDMWEQLLPHMDYVEQIYFAGGEPLMMDEHYRILEELERRGRFNVMLIYNTNLTITKFKNRSIFDYWNKFENISVAASVDAIGPRAEYIRRGTNWDKVESNLVLVKKNCPHIDFHINATLSILNAWHLPDFHKDLSNRGLINPQDLFINILQYPKHLRVDIATLEYKKRLREKYQNHIEWLRPLDSLTRARIGFEGAINFIMATDNTDQLEKFWNYTKELDILRKENALDVLPELSALII